MDQALSLYLLGHHSAAGPAGARLRPRPAHACRIHSRRPRHHPAQATRQGERRKDGRDENGRARIRPAHGGTGEARISQAQPRVYLLHLQRLRRPASRGSARKTSAPNPSPGKCSRCSGPFPITSTTTNCSAPKGLLLRHLSSVHKVLTQTVPDSAKNDAVREMELYLGTMIRQVDSSLLDEWEKMRDPNYLPRGDAGSPPARRGGSGRRYHARHQSVHRGHSQPHFHFPARPGHRRLRAGPCRI